MNDLTLATAVEAALRQTGYWRPADIAVSVSNGRVALTGEIEWDFQKRTVLYAAQSVSGVVDVIDKIVLRFVPPTLASLAMHPVEPAIEIRRRHHVGETSNLQLVVARDHLT